MQGRQNLHNGRYRANLRGTFPRHGTSPGRILRGEDVNGMKEIYTTQEIAVLWGTSQMAVLRRAKREGWQSRPRAGRGGGNEWFVASMPESTRLAIAAKVALFTPVPVKAPAPVTLSLPSRFAGNGKTRAEAKAALFFLYRMFTKTAGLPKTRGMETFSVRWNAGEIESEAWLREAIPHVSKNTLLNWERAIKTEGTARLAGDYGKGKRGKGCIDGQPEVKALIVAAVCEHPEGKAGNVRYKLEHVNEQRIEDGLEPFELPSLRRLQCWIRDWKARNPALFLSATAPGKARNKTMPSFGDFYAFVTGINQRWEYDGTPSDVMLSDNKRYAIIGVIEIYTRRVKFRVVERSTSQQVACVTRDCLLDWGVPETAVTDNGKEFTSRQMQRLFLDLGIACDILPPFRPDLKPAIERVFHTFSHDLLPIAPCYVGHDVATRQRIRDQEDFAKRLMKRAKKGEEAEALTIGMSPEELQAFCDKWTDSVYMHRQHSGLRGKTPYQMLSEYPYGVRRIPEKYHQALDVLLLPVIGTRRVTKEGIEIGGRTYIAPELGRPDVAQQDAEIRFDKARPQYAYVYLDGLFVCRAKCVDAMAPEERRQIAVDARNAMKSVRNAISQIKKDAKKNHLDTMAQDIIEMLTERAQKLVADNPVPTREVIEHVTFDLMEAQRAASGEKPMQTLTPEQAEEARAQAIELVAENEFTVPQSAQARNALFEALQTRTISGEALSADELNWISMYRTSAERAGFEAMNQLYAVNQ